MVNTRPTSVPTHLSSFLTDGTKCLLQDPADGKLSQKERNVLKRRSARFVKQDTDQENQNPAQPLAKQDHARKRCKVDKKPQEVPQQPYNLPDLASLPSPSTEQDAYGRPAPESCIVHRLSTPGTEVTFQMHGSNAPMRLQIEVRQGSCSRGSSIHYSNTAHDSFEAHACNAPALDPQSHEGHMCMACELPHSRITIDTCHDMFTLRICRCSHCSLMRATSSCFVCTPSTQPVPTRCACTLMQLTWG